MNEVWKKIDGFNGNYEVSCFGNVRSKPRKATKGGLMKLHLLKRNDYYKVRLTNPNTKKNKYYSVHRLVAQAFIPNKNNLPQVNHKNGNKHDNNVFNLEWVTCQQNIQHAYKKGLHKVRKVVQIKDGEIVKVFDNCYRASVETGINYTSIYHCLHQRQLTAGGYDWYYVNKKSIKKDMFL